jgi:hypothetical protein
MADHGMSKGATVLESVGPIAFGPDDVLFVADNRRAVVVAIDVADPAPPSDAAPFDLSNLSAKLAAFLGCAPEDVAVRDLAVHPRTHNVYLAVQRGRGDAGSPVIVRVDHLDAALSEVALDDVAFSEVALDDAPGLDDERVDIQLPTGDEGEAMEFGGRTFRILRAPIRTSTVTDLAFVDSQLLVAGLSNHEFSSTLRRIPFPFAGEVGGTSLEIFHVSHGKWETAAPIRTFVPYEGGRSILASYTCTPLVHFPLQDLAPGTHAKGRTVAELGAGNQPLDMVSYVEDGEEHLLVCHSRHPLMKIACRDIDRQSALTEPQEPVGVPWERADLTGIVRLDNWGDDQVLALQNDAGGTQHLRSLKPASL